MPAALVVLLSGCVQEMANQPRVDTLEPSAFFDDGLGVRPLVPGTVARGDLPGDAALETGRREGELLDEFPIEITQEVVQRGRERFNIYCDHCHGPAGYGDGMVVRRGFPAPPSYHIDRLREAPEGHLFRVISYGHGRMPAFSRRIEPHERWAIVAYLRALQLSQRAPVDALPERDLVELLTENGDPSE